MKPSAALTVVTAADARYGRCLTQLLRSALRRRVDRDPRWIVYDLGLEPAQRAYLHTNFPWVECRIFSFERYPPHFAMASLCYAWKAAVIHAVAQEAEGALLWLDSATLIRRSFAEPIEAIRRDGLYTLVGQTALGERCDPDVLRRLQVPLEMLDRPERVAGVIGLDPSRAFVRQLIEAWLTLTLDPQLSRPLRHTPPMHRPEQSLLSILLYRAEARGDVALPCEEIDISSARPVRWMSSRNKVSRRLPEWADAVSRLYYALYKSVDQWLWRLKAFEDRRLSGWYRYLREGFAVYVGVRGGAPVRVPAPPASYLADPFPVQEGGRRWLLAEQFRYGDNRGRLVFAELDAELKAGAWQALAIGAGHASFPYVFRHAGQLLLLPETCQRRCLDLYALDLPSGRLRRVRRLLYGFDVADSVVFHHDGRFWIITSLRAAGTGRSLALFHFGDLERGPLIPHPINAERRYAERPHSWGRCAGTPWQQEGHWLRPIHSSRNVYGESLAWMRILELNPESFREEPCPAPASDSLLLTSASLHHLAIDQNLVAGDHRLRIGFWQGLGSLLGFPGSRRTPTLPR